jgi:hypothetical protein
MDPQRPQPSDASSSKAQSSSAQQPVMQQQSLFSLEDAPAAAVILVGNCMAISACCIATTLGFIN